MPPEGIEAMVQSVWPYDTAEDRSVPQTPHSQLSCFVISPFQPKERFDDLFKLIRDACEEIKGSLALQEFICERADAITSAGIIHPEIWSKIKHADVIVADVSGRNGNVMMELGVAAAWRKKEQVIILREEDSQEPHLFDINPARHIEYQRTSVGFAALKEKLLRTIYDAIAASPFEHLEVHSVDLPLSAPLNDGVNCPELWVPEVAHRRMLSDCLEFGSLYSFPMSWLSVGNLSTRNVRVKAEMRFTERRESGSICWMGISLRAQIFWANLGHLVLLRSDGSVARTAKKTPDLNSHEDEELGRIESYSPEQFTTFDIGFDEEAWSIEVGSLRKTVPVGDLRYVFSSGRILFLSYMSRVGIRNLEVCDH